LYALSVFSFSHVFDKRYGSANGGKSVMCDPLVASMVNKIGLKLNLKKHKIATAPNIEMALCADIEIHKIDKGLVVLGRV
jgi:hypothetical protein